MVLLQNMETDGQTSRQSYTGRKYLFGDKYLFDDRHFRIYFTLQLGLVFW